MDRRGGAGRVAGTLWDYGHQCPLTARGASPVAPEKSHWLAEEERGGQGTSSGGIQVGGDNICTSMFCSNDFFEKLKWYFQLAEVMATVNQEFTVWTLDLIKQAQIKFSGIIHDLDKLKTPHLQILIYWIVGTEKELLFHMVYGMALAMVVTAMVKITFSVVFMLLCLIKYT